MIPVSILNVLDAALNLILLAYITWIAYLAVMNLRRAYKNNTLPKWAKIFGYPLLIVGYVLDFLLNMTLCTIVFCEIPHEWLVTARLQTHANEDGNRGKIARWIAINLLNPFDIKDHVRIDPKYL